jgi:hypothetical protein
MNMTRRDLLQNVAILLGGFHCGRIGIQYLRLQIN